MTWEIRVPVISTAHIKLETSVYLDLLSKSKLPQAMIVAKYPQGYFVSQLEDMYDLGAAELRVKYYDVPAELLGILLWADNKLYRWIRLDRDGDVIKELPTFEWEIKL